MKRVLAVGIPLFGILGFTILNMSNSGDRVQVETEVAGAQRVTESVSATGQVQPRRAVDVSANVSGPITELLVSEGSIGRQGQLVARIDPTAFAAAVDQAEANLKAVKGQLDEASANLSWSRTQYERSARLHSEGLISDEQLEQARTDQEVKTASVSSLDAQVKQAEALCRSARDQLSKTAVRAPMDGIVIRLLRVAGETVIGAQSYSPTVIMTIADTSALQVELLLDENDVWNLQTGQKATMYFGGSRGDQVATGRLMAIGASAVAAPTSVSGRAEARRISARVIIDDPPLGLRVGMAARVDLLVADRAAGVAIPAKALINRPTSPGDTTGGVARQDGAFVVEQGRVRFRPLRLGVIGTSWVEVLSGIAAGETVVTGPLRALRSLQDGTAVRVPGGTGSPPPPSEGRGRAAR